MEVHFLNPFELTRDPAREGALDERGRLRVLDTAFWYQFNQTEIAHFCVTQGLYCIPTTELVAWLKERIAGRPAIEIGAGTGALCAALGIKGTDNYMQTWPEIRSAYDSIAQAPVAYGPHVEERDAERAVGKYRPKVVVAAWVTHKYRVEAHWREGNKWGVSEEKILQAPSVEEYLFVGNRHVHRHKPLLDLPHEEFEFPWLISRTMTDAPNFIASWRK